MNTTCWVNFKMNCTWTSLSTHFVPSSTSFNILGTSGCTILSIISLTPFQQYHCHPRYPYQKSENLSCSRHSPQLSRNVLFLLFTLLHNISYSSQMMVLSSVVLGQISSNCILHILSTYTFCDVNNFFSINWDDVIHLNSTDLHITIIFSSAFLYSLVMWLYVVTFCKYLLDASIKVVVNFTALLFCMYSFK